MSIIPGGDIKLSANFELNINKPLDARVFVSDITERNGISFRYAGMIVYVFSEETHYKLENDLVTWTEFGSNLSLYKTLSFVIDQTGTTDPSLTILENNVSLSGATRISTGIYRLETNSSFTLNKTFLLPSFNPSDNYYIDKHDHPDENFFYISCRDILGDLRDVITNKYLEIRVYN